MLWVQTIIFLGKTFSSLNKSNWKFKLDTEPFNEDSKRKPHWKS